ncbi:MAG: aminopeptidase P family protein [Chloroflexi bacterium]|nr:aminopeptidase P family protein [Chloroflexota bacterium]
MHQTQRQQTADLLKARGLDRALFAHAHSVTWLTGFVAPVQTGTNLFSGGPPLVWYDGGQFTLIVQDVHAADAAAFAPPDCALLSYRSYTTERPITSAENLADVLRSVVKLSGASAGKVGMERQWLTAFLHDALREALSDQVEIVPIDGWLAPLRAIKTDDELALLRRNFALCDIGQAAARQATRPGVREIDVWVAAESAINQAAGYRVPLGNDCVVGYRSPNNVGGWPLDYELHPGDSLIVDISAFPGGYWSDGCATYYAGEPTLRQQALHRVVREALEYGISLVRPGIVARDLDRRIREFIEQAGYPAHTHHTGHGVGVSGHEAPRIVPYSDDVLQAGMVIMLEPGIYFPGETGVRLEDGLLITSDGVEVLTRHDKGW